MRISVNSEYQNSWEDPKSDNQINFDHISTPSTSYGFIYCYDYTEPEAAPNQLYAHNEESTDDNPVGFYDLFSKLADRVDYVENMDAKKSTIISALKRSKKYRAFFFAGFAHGGHATPPGIEGPVEGKKWSYASLPIDSNWKIPVKYTRNNYWETYMNKELYPFEIWEELKDATGMYLMFFDHCYAYGMQGGVEGAIKPEIPEPPVQPRSIQNNQNFGTELLDMFKNNQMQQRDISFDKGIKLQMVTSTSDADLSAYYYKGQYTYFSAACTRNIMERLQEYDHYISATDTTTKKYISVLRKQKKCDSRYPEFINYIKGAIWDSLYGHVGGDKIEGTVPAYGYVGDDLTDKMVWC